MAFSPSQVSASEARIHNARVTRSRSQPPRTGTFIAGRTVVGAVLRTPRLRNDIPERLTALLRACICTQSTDAANTSCSTSGAASCCSISACQAAWLCSAGERRRKNTTISTSVSDTVMRFRDPRRFGVLDWLEGHGQQHPLLSALGVEPLTDDFSGDWLYQATRTRNAPIKPVLMDAHLIVGIGNIYAAESLFLAGISPCAPPAASAVNAVRDWPEP